MILPDGDGQVARLRHRPAERRHDDHQHGHDRRLAFLHGPGAGARRGGHGGLRRVGAGGAAAMRCWRVGHRLPAATIPAVLYQVTHGPPPPVPVLPPAIQKVLRRALDKNPARRFRSAGAFAGERARRPPAAAVQAPRGRLALVPSRGAAVGRRLSAPFAACIGAGLLIHRRAPVSVRSARLRRFPPTPAIRTARPLAHPATPTDPPSTHCRRHARPATSRQEVARAAKVGEANTAAARREEEAARGKAKGHFPAAQTPAPDPSPCRSPPAPDRPAILPAALSLHAAPFRRLRGVGGAAPAVHLAGGAIERLPPRLPL